jgi:hypothetical protein
MSRLFSQMKPLLILHRGLVAILLTFSLAGCVADQKEALLACKDVMSHASSDADHGPKNEHDYDSLADRYVSEVRREAKYLEDCMARKGYERDGHQTMCGLEPLKYGFSEDPYCYVPKYRIARLIYMLESRSRPGPPAFETWRKIFGVNPKTLSDPESNV